MKRAVLVGTDFMYRHDGKLVPIEINTNVGWDDENRLELFSDIFDLTDLISYLQRDNIEKVYLEGQLFGLETLFTEFVKRFQKAEIVCERYESDEKCDENSLILRSSYSETAVVDRYAANKVAFRKLIQTEDFASEYLTSDGEGQITECPDNGNFPNFILKSKYPNYSREKLPALYRVSTVEDAENILNSMVGGSSLLLEPYNFSREFGVISTERGLREKLIRNWSAFVLEDDRLTSISLGSYTKISYEELDEARVAYDESGKLISGRKTLLVGGDYDGKFFTKADVILESSDEVQMSDGTWKDAKDLQIDDEVRSINIPVEGNVDLSIRTVDYNIKFDKLVEESNYVSVKVLRIDPVDKLVDKVKVKFEEIEEDWFDDAMSAYLGLDPEDETVRFRYLKDVKVGDKLLFVDTTVEELQYRQVTVKSINTVREFVSGYVVSVENPHLLVSREKGSAVGIASIEHNWSTQPCRISYSANNPPECTCTDKRNKCSSVGKSIVELDYNDSSGYSSGQVYITILIEPTDSIAPFTCGYSVTSNLNNFEQAVGQIDVCTSDTERSWDIKVSISVQSMTSSGRLRAELNINGQTFDKTDIYSSNQHGLVAYGLKYYTMLGYINVSVYD